MNCLDIDKNLLAYIDHALSADEMTAMTGHINHCDDCQKKQLNELHLQSQMKALPDERIDSSFKLKILDQIKEDAPGKRLGSGFWQGFGVATAASFMIWVFVGFGSVDLEIKETTPTIVTASVDEVKNIRLAFDAPADFKNVTMVIELPDFAELKGYEGQKIIRWNTHLADGKNILNLPIIIKSSEQGQVIAKIIANDKTKIFTVPLGV